MLVYYTGKVTADYKSAINDVIHKLDDLRVMTLTGIFGVVEAEIPEDDEEFRKFLGAEQAIRIEHAGEVQYAVIAFVVLPDGEIINQ